MYFKKLNVCNFNPLLAIQMSLVKTYYKMSGLSVSLTLLMGIANQNNYERNAWKKCMKEIHFWKRSKGLIWQSPPPTPRAKTSAFSNIFNILLSSNLTKAREEPFSFHANPWVLDTQVGLWLKMLKNALVSALGVGVGRSIPQFSSSI